ncbi:hypothetical protein [Lysinibacillus sp. NPDC047702]|uniref:hypothetical protein n=1 Tax=unclassified Lysinibacillus TaxID=2636778 RepID=UPI003D077E3E
MALSQAHVLVKSQVNIINLLLKIGEELNCEVVYIGKSFGTNGNRNVFDRLESHSTLQQIYFEKEDDRSIYLTAWNFDRNTMTIVSPNSNYETYKERLMTQLELERLPYESISLKQEISFTEAALIRYFQPIYNTEFKKSFPSITHSDYSDCYKMNLDYIAVEMDTKRLNFKLYSDEVAAEYKHDIFFDLKGKRNFYDFMII